MPLSWGAIGCLSGIRNLCGLRYVLTLLVLETNMWMSRPWATHLNPPARFSHTPPFMHGRVSHSLTSASQCWPLNPAGHWQRYLSMGSVRHTPSFSQGADRHGSHLALIEMSGSSVEKIIWNLLIYKKHEISFHIFTTRMTWQSLLNL